MSRISLKTNHRTSGKRSFHRFIEKTMILSIASLSMAVYAQNTERNSLSNDSLINQYVHSKGGSIVVFDSSNIKQFWIDNSVANKDNNINILLNSNYESNPLKIQLANVNGRQDCIIEVLSENENVVFSVSNSSSKSLATSTKKDDFLQYHVTESTPVHLDETMDYSFFLKFQSTQSNLAIKKIILSFPVNKNYLASPGVVVLSENTMTAKKGVITNNKNTPNSFFVTGRNSEILSDKKILVTDNTLTASVKVKNTGKVPATVYCGYAPFTADNQQINNKNNPYKTNKVLSIVSSEANSTILIVDSYPEWENGCFLVLNAKEDFSDFPNFSFLDGTIDKITQIDDTHTEIHLDKPIKNAIEKGTKIRVQSMPRSSYLYMDSKTLNPGEEASFSSSIKKDDSFLRYSSTAFCRGTFYVVPIILSNSNSAENTIEITDFKISY